MQRLVSTLNLAVLCAAYYRIVRLDASSTAYTLAVLIGSILLIAAAIITLSERVRATWTGLMAYRLNGALRFIVVIVPWLALFAVTVIEGLWWTQRPAELRFFVTYALVNWSILWCISKPWTPSPSQTRRVVFWLAVVLWIFGVDGAAFGVTPFGCSLSALMATSAAGALCVASFATVSASLKLFAACAATLLGVAIVEVSVRVLHVGQNVQETDRREYAREFYSLTPPRAAFVNNPTTLDEFGPALIEINSLGIRGPELPEARADVLLIGDSMIEARQLPWAQTVGPRLQQAFQARSMPLRVVSHGMRGWSPLLEWNWYLKVGRKLHPKTVLLFFFWNDLWTSGDEALTFRAVLRPDGRPEYFDVPVDTNWIWYKHVRVVRLVADVWQRLSVSGVKHAFSDLTARSTSAGASDIVTAQQRARSLSEPPLTDAEIRALLTQPEDQLDQHLRPLVRKSFWPSIRPWRLWTETQRSAAERTELKLRRFAEDVAADGARLVIVFVPNPLQIAPSECAVGRLFDRVDTDVVLPPESGIQDWLRGVADRNGIELLDPSKAMREYAEQPTSDSAPLYLRADCHWSQRGHQFMAAYLAAWFDRSVARHD